ncbi:hypothetical protein MMC07_007965 [Pseudocyphellaria aurata]|nr:hypothetical protein [Pseudocyphellaria aurata]
MAEAIANAGAKAIAFLESEHEPCGPGQSAVIRLYKNTDISARLYQVELRSDKAMEEVMTEIDNDLGSLDILLDFSPVLNEYANDDILRVKGSEKSFAFVASRAFTRCRLLKPREDEASIITVAPFSHNHQPDSSAFLDGSSSKVVQFGQVCKSLAIRWARHQIRVNCVEMRYHPKTLRVGPHTPRIQFPELDSAVVWLASPASKWVTGSRFNLLEIPHPSYTAQNNVVTIQWYLKNDVSPPAIAKS